MSDEIAIPSLKFPDKFQLLIDKFNKRKKQIKKQATDIDNQQQTRKQESIQHIQNKFLNSLQQLDSSFPLENLVESVVSSDSSVSTAASALRSSILSCMSISPLSSSSSSSSFSFFPSFRLVDSDSVSFSSSSLHTEENDEITTTIPILSQQIIQRYQQLELLRWKIATQKIRQEAILRIQQILENAPNLTSDVEQLSILRLASAVLNSSSNSTSDLSCNIPRRLLSFVRVQ